MTARGQLHVQATSPPGEGGDGSYWIGGSEGHTDRMGISGVRQVSFSCWQSNHESSIVQPVYYCYCYYYYYCCCCYYFLLPRLLLLLLLATTAATITTIAITTTTATTTTITTTTAAATTTTTTFLWFHFICSLSGVTHTNLMYNYQLYQSNYSFFFQWLFLKTDKCADSVTFQTLLFFECCWSEVWNNCAVSSSPASCWQDCLVWNCRALLVTRRSFINGLKICSEVSEREWNLVDRENTELVPDNTELVPDIVTVMLVLASKSAFKFHTVESVNIEQSTSP